ncbi:MAG: serine/threonine-protein kinase [Byssovorax sp.]
MRPSEQGCPSDNEIAARVGRRAGEGLDELDRHLAECASCRSVVARLASLAQESTVDGGALSTGDRDGETSSNAPITAGSKVGRYVVRSVLGAGAMGTVYVAHDPELDRRVALKVLRPELGAGPSASAFRARLGREARAMARLSRPEVVAVYDSGAWDGRLYIAMELVSGKTLRAWLAEEKRPWREVLERFLQAGRGLAAAHEAGIVHRDFKPDNVLVGDDGRARVTDFGLARAASEGEAAPASSSAPRSSGSPLATARGTLIGTPAYMAPEQLRGEPADARSDVFSYCLSLYEALYGERPFHGDSMDALLASISGAPPRPPRSAVPSWLARAVLRGLRAAPEARPASMDELLRALERGARRRGLTVFTAAALGALAIAAVIAARVTAPKPVPCPSAEPELAGVWDDDRRAQVREAFERASLPFSAQAFASTRASLDAYARDWAAMRASSCEATRVRGEQSEELLDLRAQCLAQRRRELSAVAELLVKADKGTVTNAAGALAALGPLSACADATALRAVVRLPADPAAKRRIEDAQAAVARAHAMEGAGKMKEARDAAVAVVAIARAEQHPPLLAEALFVQGNTQLDVGDSRAGIASLEEAVATAEAAHDDGLRARSLCQMAFNFGTEQRRFDEAHRLLHLCGGAVARAGGGDGLRAFHLRREGSVLASEGKLGEAVEALRRALDLQRRAGGEASVPTAETLSSLGHALMLASRHEEAIAVFRDAIAIQEKLYGPDYAMSATPLLHIGYTLRLLGRNEEAIAPLSRALAIRRAAYPPGSPVVLEAVLHLGEVLMKLHRYEDAAALMEPEMARYPDHFDPQDDLRPGLEADLGDALVHTGQRARGLDLMKTAIAHQRARGEETLFVVGQMEVGLATAEWDDPRLHAGARALAEDARALLKKAPEGEAIEEKAAVEALLARP